MTDVTESATPQGDGTVRIRRALVSVANKGGLVPFARALAERGVAIVSSGTTAAVLREGGVPVTAVADVTGFPEMLDGRVKTLHPRIHAGILADRRKPDHLAQLESHGIEPFDLVVVNLYPFLETVVAGAGLDDGIEQIDVGGPSMVRAAAKNFESVGVIVRPDDYEALIAEIDQRGGLLRSTRMRLAREAFEHMSAYDSAIAVWLGERQADLPPPAAAAETMAPVPPSEEVTAQQPAVPVPAGASEDDVPGLPELVAPRYLLRAPLRYGENPHQRASVYGLEGGPGPLGGAEVLQGKEMSYNNWLDTEAARALAALFDRPAAVIVKHHNPCGVAVAGTLAEAYGRALDGDRVSAFGGIVAFNREVEEEAAQAMAGVFTEVVVAPAYTEGALAVYGQKQNLRVVLAPLPDDGGLELRPIDGGALVQDMDQIVETDSDMKAVTTKEPTTEQWEDLLFAWIVAARVKSNAIVLVRDRATVGIGAGQMNRVNSVDLASRQAGEKARGSSLASDAFFPFRDSLDRAAEVGVAAVIQPGGSVRDEEVIASAEEHGMAMVFTGRRHFRH